MLRNDQTPQDDGRQGDRGAVEKTGWLVAVASGALAGWVRPEEDPSPALRAPSRPEGARVWNTPHFKKRSRTSRRISGVEGASWMVDSRCLSRTDERRCEVTLDELMSLSRSAFFFKPSAVRRPMGSWRACS